MLTFENDYRGIGLATRGRRPGPEAELVTDFVRQLPTIFAEGNQLAVFREPALETGYPDLVVAEYCPRVFNGWSASRSRLIPADLKILQHLYSVHGADAASLEAHLGMRSKQVLYALERLLDAGIVVRTAGKWKPARLKTVFGISRLIAIEAKVNNWDVVLGQSAQNRWFASETYALTPVTRPRPRTLQRAADLGIGILSFSKCEIQELQRSSKSRLPACYATWLFNEWIGRRLHADT